MSSGFRLDADNSAAGGRADFFAADVQPGLDPSLEDRFNRAMYSVSERAQAYSTPSYSSLGGIHAPAHRSAYGSLGGSDHSAYLATGRQDLYSHRMAYESLGDSDPSAYRAPPSLRDTSTISGTTTGSNPKNMREPSGVDT